MKRPALALFGIIMSICPLSAQKDLPPKKLRFMPLGSQPTWIEGKLSDTGVRRPVEPKEGETPPNPLSVLSGEVAVPFRLDLLKFTETLEIDDATPGLLLQTGPAAAPQPWLRKRMPPSAHSLGVFFPDHKTMNWKQPKLLLFNDTETAFPAGTIRVINVSNRNVLLQIGSEKAQIIGIRPGKSTRQPIKPGTPLIRLGYQDAKGNKQWPESNRKKVLSGQRVQAFAYKPLKAKPHPVTFHIVPEAAKR